MVRTCVFGFLFGLLVLPTLSSAGEDVSESSVDELVVLLDADGARERADAAEALAGCADERVPAALEARLALEKNFHVKLALHYALARHGRRSDVYALIDALDYTGHLGSVYLGWLASNFGRDHGWNQSGWRTWIDGVSDETWKEWQRRRHLPWVASDADEAGFVAAVAWWDGLGYPDVGALPFVLVDAFLRETELSEDGSPASKLPGSPAWLLGEDDESFRVFTHGLRVMTIRKGTPHYDPLRGTYERTDVGAFVLDAIADSPRSQGEMSGSERSTGTPPAAPGGWTADYWDRNDPMHLAPYSPPEWFRAFVLAVSCWKHGAKEPALAIWARLAMERPHGVQAPPWTTLDYLRGVMRVAEERHLILAFGDMTLSLADLVGMHRVFLTRFGAHEAATARLRVLERMTGEEEARRQSGRPAFELLSVEQRVDELVWRLREPGAALDPAWKQAPSREAAWSTPFGQLVELGYVAVPRLIEALSDDTLTRSVIYHDTGHGQWEGWDHVERVGDVALRALQRLSARSFDYPTAEYGMMMGGPDSLFDEDQVEAVSARVRAWWEACQERGEAAVLAELVVRGGREAVASVRRLAQLDPDAARRALIEAIPATTEPWDRDLLVALLRLVPGPETTEFLHRELLGSPRLGMRLAAADTLRALDDPKALEAMIREWRQLAPRSADERTGREEEPLEELIKFLATSGRADAVRVLGEHVALQSPATRAAVVRAMRIATGLEWGEEARHAGSESADVMDAVEEVLRSLVLDEGLSGGNLQVTGPGARALDVCTGDQAAATLAELWPDRHAFDASASLAARRRARTVIANLARREQGLDPLPLPPASTAPEPVAEAQAQALLDALVAAEDDVHRDRARQAVVEAGLGMLPSLVKRRSDIANDAPARAALDDVVRELGNRVVAVVFADEGPAPDDALRAAASALVGRPLTGEGFAALLLHITRRTPYGSVGARVAVRRDKDLSGVSLHIRLLTERVITLGAQKGWDVLRNLRVGSVGLIGSAGMFSLEYGREARAWTRFAGALDEALTRPLDEVIEGEVVVRLEG